MTKIKTVLGNIKRCFDNFMIEWWLFHPIIAFSFFLKPIVEIAKTEHTTGEAIALAFTFFFCNAFYCLMWEYKRHLIKRDKERRRKQREIENISETV